MAEEDRQQRDDGGADGHHLGAHAVDCAGEHGGAQVGAGGSGDALAHLIPGFVEIDDHDHAGLGGHAREGDEADGHGHAEVVVERPQQPDAADEGEGHTKGDDERFAEVAEVHVEEQQDEHEREWDDPAEGFFGPLHILELATPLQVVAGGDLDLLADVLLGLFDVRTEM